MEINTKPVSYTHLDVSKRQVTGLAKNINNYHDTTESIEILQEKIKSVRLNPVFVENSGSGKRASTRLPHFIPLGEQIFTNEN